jgi:asparagine synthase (glutamine-hydrolysing)
MCGIFASIGFPCDRQRISVIAHRGPDGEGWQEFRAPFGDVALGHRRLSIIDVSEAGHQPMSDPTGRYHITFNGEIYNFEALKRELEAKGEIFKTHCDTEVLLRCYVVWGKDMLHRLRGMFAFAVWDEKNKILFAARDRFGIKPLYFTRALQGMAIASEIKQLLGLPSVTGRMNVARVHDFLASGISNHTDETMFEGVYQLRGGEWLEVAVGTPYTLTIQRWYDTHISPINVSESDAADTFRQLLSDSVKLHLRSDVPIGSCLSGGLDSSSIVCLMAQMLNDEGQGAKVRTVSACYAEKEVDEKPYMDSVIQHAQTHSNFIYPKAEDVFQKASDITWHQDEPFGSSSIFAQWCVFEGAKDAGIKVMLDGQGADEQLAGYHSGFPYYIAMLMRQGRWIQLLRTMFERRHYHNISITEQLQRLVGAQMPLTLQRMILRHMAPAKAYDWLNTPLIAQRGNPLGAFKLATQTLNLPDVTDLSSLCMTMTHASNLQMLLHWEDRNSMAHGIEARVPFLDHPLVEFCLGLGNDHKIVGGDTKRVLRRAMSGILPEDVRERRDKLGFATPEERWFRGPLRGLMKDGVERTLAMYPELFDVAQTRALTGAMLDGRIKIDFAIWRIVNLGLWGQRFGVTI